MASFTRFRPDKATKMTTSEVDSAEAWFEDHLNYARNVLLGVINKESKVGGPTYELSATSKREITASVDWNYAGYKASFTFKGRFKPDDAVVATGRLKAVTGIYHYDGMQTGIAMEKIKGIKIDALVRNDIDANREETLAQLNKGGRLIGHDDQDDEFDLQNRMYDDWKKPKVLAMGGDDYIQVDYEGCSYSKRQKHILDGGDGDDTIEGGAGNDKIIGGSGENKLSGGCGKDRFYLQYGGVQIIEDFYNQEDVLDYRKVGGKNNVEYDAESGHLSKEGELLAIIPGLDARHYQ